MERERLYFLDWLRFFAVIVLIFFHSSLIFSSETNFPIKNNELSALLEEFVFFVHGWRLGLLFFISGVGTSIVLQFRHRSTYLKERLRRLLIPLVFGILVIVPPQIYFERLHQGFVFDSFFSFYLQSFSTGLYPYGNISWNHLWFIAYLLIYSILSVPIFALIKGNDATWMESVMSKGGIVLWAIPLAMVIVILKPYSLGIQNIVNDLAMFFFYWLVFLAGFTIHRKSYWRFFENRLLPLLIAVIVLTTASYFIKWNFSQMEKGDSVYLTFNFVKAVNSWLCILALLAFGIKYFNKPGKFLPLLNESVYPVYILHQTVIICVGYYIVQQQWSIGAKFLILTSTTFIICWILFLFLRLNKGTRILFGMRSPKKCKTNCEFNGAKSKAG